MALICLSVCRYIGILQGIFSLRDAVRAVREITSLEFTVGVYSCVKVLSEDFL